MKQKQRNKKSSNKQKKKSEATGKKQKKGKRKIKEKKEKLRQKKKDKKKKKAKDKEERKTERKNLQSRQCTTATVSDECLTNALDVMIWERGPVKSFLKKYSRFTKFTEQTGNKNAKKSK